MEQNDENLLYSSVNLNYDTLEHIFQFLNGRDLENASMVCWSWSEPANKEKWRRGHCHCFIKPDEIYSLLSYIENTRIIPSAGFFFVSLLFDRDSVEDYVRNVLHEHCEIIILYAFGVFVDYDMRFTGDMICAFLPQIPNVRIETYKVREPFMETWDTINMLQLNVSHEMSKSNHEASTCFMMMIFCSYAEINFTLAKNFISFVQERKTFKIASISTIMLHDIYVPCKTSRRGVERIYGPNCTAVVITGPVYTWSVILDDKYSTQEHIEARLQLFKDEVKLQKHSLGFMFSHRKRATNLHREMARTIFKRLFPEISPLVGCLVHHLEHVNYEKTTDEVNEEKNDKDDHKCEILQSLFTDIYIMFLILTYGDVLT